MHFNVQSQSYHFKALPFGLSTAPMEFTVVAKDKLPGSKGSLSSPKHFQDLCLNNIVLIATNNTTVVECINKEGG